MGTVILNKAPETVTRKTKDCKEYSYNTTIDGEAVKVTRYKYMHKSSLVEHKPNLDKRAWLGDESGSPEVITDQELVISLAGNVS